MKFIITKIQFDWDNEDADELTIYEKQDILEETIGQIWDADDEEDLIEEVTCAYGWCIKSIDYNLLLS